MKLVSKIAAYIFREEDKIKKGVDEIMGGKVLQLGSERLREKGREEGRVEVIGAMVKGDLEEGMTEVCILEKLQKWFSFDEEQAQIYYRKFSGQDQR